MSTGTSHAPTRRNRPLTVALVGLCLTVWSAGALAIERYRSSDVANHECPLIPADVIRHHIVPESLQSAWRWTPPGVTCVYATRDGGTVEYGPAPTWTIVLLVGGVGAVAAPAGAIVHFVRRTRQHPPAPVP
ncbi:hypothetical protein [Salinibacterium sp. ZJ70]|uniref:hypothetical protein n=1 Tax=Salinibacterium sp. ZJ70 TaxID=2708084 RepID=UPI0014209B96|nr:hypothetical protein [Salinibacterium sp. ZJ70]